jgi:hypothetical protein
VSALGDQAPAAALAAAALVAHPNAATENPLAVQAAEEGDEELPPTAPPILQRQVT